MDFGALEHRRYSTALQGTKSARGDMGGHGGTWGNMGHEMEYVMCCCGRRRHGPVRVPVDVGGRRWVWVAPGGRAARMDVYPSEAGNQARIHS